MARIRTIKPDFFRHHKLYALENELNLPIRIAFAGLWTACDREGRFKWSVPELKLDCLPFDDLDFSRVLDALTTRGFVKKYTVDGCEYGVVPSFHKHQSINNKERVSDIPEPVENTAQSNASSTRSTRDLTKTKGKGREGNKVEKEITKVISQKKSNKGTRLKSGWVVPDEWIEWAASQGMQADRTQRESEKFSDYWPAQPGQRGVKSDWFATWRNWIRKAIDDSKPVTGTKPKTEIAETMEWLNGRHKN